MENKLYKDLDVPVDASGEAIKKAFREKSKKHHPDKGGDESKFKEIQLAYSVLSDDDKRRRYDSTGDEEPEQTQIIGLCIQIFKGAVDQNSRDISAGIDSVVNGIVGSLKHEISQLKKSIKKNEDVISRIEKSPSNDFLKYVLETEIKADNKAIGIRSKRIVETREAWDMLSCYSFSILEKENCDRFHQTMRECWTL